MEILCVFLGRNQFLYFLQSVIGGVDVRVGKPRPSMRAWVVSELVSQDHWVMTLKQRMELVLLLPWAISPTPVVMGVANSLKCLGHFPHV